MGRKLMSVGILLLVMVSVADAGPFRRGRVRGAYVTQYQQTSTQSVVSSPGQVETTYTTETTVTTTGISALDEVNAKRAARGLRPFVHDPLLTQAAERCASFRANYRLFGHTNNDFQFLPPGATATSAGCAAYPSSYGWMSCCTYDGYTYAGAAYAMGPDGKRYMHLFVR